jgi:hypothetical protein
MGNLALLVNKNYWDLASSGRFRRSVPRSVSKSLVFTNATGRCDTPAKRAATENSIPNLNR